MDAAAPLAGLRPRLHFAPRAGWVGDLFGVLRVAGRYHLFFAHDPAGRRTPGGDPVWGAAVSDDLVIWSERAAGPPPGPAGRGCGSVVAGPDGPVLFHRHGDEAGGVCRATAAPGLTGWRPDPAGPVIAKPPVGVLRMFDPYVWAADDGWRMLVGASLPGGVAAALQFRSTDLRSWAYDGILASRDDAQWRRPQLFRLGGSWVLLVASSYAVGDYDGARFTARAWGEFGRGRIGATSTFLDASGRRCLLARLGEETGVLSVPWVLSVHGDCLFATPHPHLDRYLTNGVAGLTAAGGEVLDHGEAILRMPAGGETTVLADADIVEVTVEGVSGVGAARRSVPGAPGVRIVRFAGSR